jgi:hypothetical protein
VLGNHDYHQNPEAEITYSKKGLDWRWNMEDHFYSKSFTTDSGLVVQFLFIDTIYLAPNAIDQTPVDDPVAKKNAELMWLEDQLDNSDADWIFVVGHYPVFSIGSHGDTVELQNELLGLMEMYEVDGYFCGHDHSMQHLSKNQVQYYLSGNGSKNDTLPKTTSATVNFAKADPGFMIHEVRDANMTVQVIDYTGAEIYSFVQARNFGEESYPPIPGDGDDDKSLAVTTKVFLGILVTAILVVIGFFVYRKYQGRPAVLGSPNSKVPLGTVQRSHSGPAFDDPDDGDLEDDVGFPQRK